jgi:hypothetical protein
MTTPDRAATTRAPKRPRRANTAPRRPNGDRAGASVGFRLEHADKADAVAVADQIGVNLSDLARTALMGVVRQLGDRYVPDAQTDAMIDAVMAEVCDNFWPADTGGRGDDGQGSNRAGQFV